MRRLIRGFAGHTYHFVGNLMSQLIMAELWLNISAPLHWIFAEIGTSDMSDKIIPVVKMIQLKFSLNLKIFSNIQEDAACLHPNHITTPLITDPT